METDRQGNPFSFLCIQRLSYYSLLTTNASCRVEGASITETASLFAFWSVIHSCLCLFRSYSYIKCWNLNTPSLSHPACKPGYFKPSISGKFCQVCPDNTKPSTAGATECQCEEGFFRSPSDPPTSACSGNNPTRCHITITITKSTFSSLEAVSEDQANCCVSSASSPSST